MDELLLLQQILSLVSQLTGDEANVAKEHVPYSLEFDLRTARAELGNAIYGLPAAYYDRQDILTAIQNVRLDTASPHIGTITDVLDAIAAIPPFELPVTPPPGYGGGDTSSLWSTVVDVAQMCGLD